MLKMLLIVNPYRLFVKRNGKKITENRTIIQYLLSYVTQRDYFATMFTQAITVNAPEFLENIQIPERASYIKIIIMLLESAIMKQARMRGNRALQAAMVSQSIVFSDVITY